MAIWKVTAKKKFNNGSVSFKPCMSVEITADIVSTSFLTQSQYRKAIAERFVSKYDLGCSISKFEQQVNNANFYYTLVSK